MRNVIDLCTNLKRNCESKLLSMQKNADKLQTVLNSLSDGDDLGSILRNLKTLKEAKVSDIRNPQCDIGNQELRREIQEVLDEWIPANRESPPPSSLHVASAQSSDAACGKRFSDDDDAETPIQEPHPKWE